jgi:hypothetical protein
LIEILSQEVKFGGIALTGPNNIGSYSLSLFYIGGNGSLNNHKGNARFMKEFFILEISFF